MTSETFVDTSGFFAAINPHDQWHEPANSILEQTQPRLRLLTTDYVLDETATLLRTRGQTHLVEPWLEQVLTSSHCHVVWMDPDRFEQVRRFFARHRDKQWSFTDCFSFCVMKDRKMRSALASDDHFRQAGFEPLLIS